MINFTQHVIVSAVISYPLLSLVEYLVHRHIMHSPRLARASNNKYLWEAFWQHAAIHHRQCYDVFNHDDRPCAAVNITIKPMTSLLVALVPCAIVLMVDPLTSVILLMGAMINGAVWSRVHAEMHRPTTAWICRSTLFKYLRRMHFLHHRHPGQNFNALCPMWDWVLGTAARETARDLAEMERETWRIRSNSTPVWQGAVSKRIGFNKSYDSRATAPGNWGRYQRSPAAAFSNSLLKAPALPSDVPVQACSVQGGANPSPGEPRG